MSVKVEIGSSGVSNDSSRQALEGVVRSIRNAKRIVVVCGAGISTAASIPDFRSSTGLFNREEPFHAESSTAAAARSAKCKGKSRASGHSVKDLFHVKSLNSPTLLADHHALLTQLASQCTQAHPTPFHSFLSTLEAQGRLLRCYTQNIDGLEAKAGMEVGVPPPQVKSPRSPRTPRKNKAIGVSSGAPPTPESPGTPGAATEIGTNVTDVNANLSVVTVTPTKATKTSAVQPPIPRCIPLHGQLSHLHCPLCSASFPLSDFLPLPPDIIPCPECHLAASIRHALSERQRRIGSLRASVVLYGEEHPHGERIGNVIEKDLKGSRSTAGSAAAGVDLLIVAGTSLTIPGVKRLVKEMSKALHARHTNGGRGQGARAGMATETETETYTPRTVFINNELPKGSEWLEAFDVWIQGDIQQFITAYAENPSFEVKPLVKPTTPRKRKTPMVNLGLPTPPSESGDTHTSTTKGRNSEVDSGTPTKRRKMPPTPQPTPPSAANVDDKHYVDPIDSDMEGRSFWSRLDPDRSLTPLEDMTGDAENPFLVTNKA